VTKTFRTALVAVLVLGVLSGVARAAPAPAPTPVFAYFYIWFNATSWNRAKTDFPLVGRYSSDERSVMERQVQLAKESGINGFIVSWKSTTTLDRRLQTLVDVATRQHFQLAIIYQGLDFHRRPLPAGRVGADLKLFARRYAPAAPFQRSGKPLVIWSGTWRFTPAQVARVTEPVRGSLRVLASEKSTKGYMRLSHLVDGDAYYWSSVDPFETPGYGAKMREMSQAVHRAGGMWVAPAAAGFDARLVGGTRIVPRRDGATLRRGLDVATSSSPDLIGLISWNEYSENSHIEPSRAYGFQELRVVGDVLGARVPSSGDIDSSQSSPTGSRYGLPLIAGFTVVLLGGGVLMYRRRRGPARQPDYRRRWPDEDMF
jgi:hypothetical protein